MKKILSIFTMLLLVFSLVACSSLNPNDNENDKDNDLEDLKVVVNFETNGGSAINKQEITLENVSSFKLPENPTKEGFEFKGWFVDENCVNQFTTLSDITGTVTLYAKWEEITENLRQPIDLTKGLDVSFSFNVNVKNNSYDQDYIQETDEYKIVEEIIDYVATVNVDYKVAKLEVEKLEDLDTSLTISVKMDSVDEDFYLPFDEEGIEFKINVKNGKVYIVIPGLLIESSEDLMVSVDIMTVYNKYAPIVETLLAEYSQYLPEEFDLTNIENMTIDEIIGMINETITPYLGMVDDLGITEEFKGNVLALLALLTPVSSVDGDTTTYSLSEQQINLFFDALTLFVNNNIDSIYNISMNIKALLDSETDGDGATSGAIDEEGNIFPEDATYYIDANGNMHNYSEDTAYRFGYINSDGYYITYYTNNYIYDTQDNFKAILASQRYIYGDDLSFSIYLFREDPLHYIQDREIKDIKELLPYIDKFTSEEYPNIFYCYANDTYYNDKLEVVSKETIVEFRIEEGKKNLIDYIDKAKEYLTLNKFAVSLTKDQLDYLREAEFDFDIKLSKAYYPYDYDKNEYTTSTEYIEELSLVITSNLTINNLESSIELTTTDYVDFTEDFMTMIDGMLENITGNQPE